MDSLELKINPEIRDYTESVFFGLSIRQFIFSALAVLIAVGMYFLLKPGLGMETLSWACTLAAAPFAALGFFKYHGMTAEQFLVVWFRDAILEPRVLTLEEKTDAAAEH